LLSQKISLIVGLWKYLGASIEVKYSNEDGLATKRKLTYFSLLLDSATIYVRNIVSITMYYVSNMNPYKIYLLITNITLVRMELTFNTIALSSIIKVEFTATKVLVRAL